MLKTQPQSSGGEDALPKELSEFSLVRGGAISGSGDARGFRETHWSSRAGA